LALSGLFGCGTPVAATAVDASETWRGFAVAELEFIAKQADASPIAEVAAAAEVTPSDASTQIVDSTNEVPPDAAPEIVDAGPALAPDNGIGNDGFCFYGALPAVPASTSDSPMPAKCKLPLPVFSEKTMDFPPTLEIEMGNYDANFAWHPIKDGDWLPMWGSQTINTIPAQMMTFPNYRLKLPGQDTAKVMIQAQATGWIECVNVAGDAMPTPWLVQTAQNEMYTNVSADHPALFLFFLNLLSKSNSWKNCGQWLQIRVAVRDYKNPLQQQWGEVVRMVRLYDMTKMKSPL